MESSPQRKEQRRKNRGIPLRPFALSLALHGGVLALLVPLVDNAPPRATATAMLHGILLPASADNPQKSAVQEMAPATLAVPHASRSIHSTALRKNDAPAPPMPKAAVSPAPTFAQPVGTPGADGIPASRETDESARMAPTAETTLAPAGPDQAGLRQFRLSLAGAARRFRRYPESARQAGVTGTAEVRVAVEAGEALRRIELFRSSGHAILDRAALDMLRQAASRAVLPESLRGQSFVVLLPVVFAVEE